MEIRRINNGKIFYFGNDVIPKYSFNAKELDEETGMYYFEARYYRAPTFISRDPLMNEKPWLTPYHYCSNNPVGRIDPSGMMDDEYEFNQKGELLNVIKNDEADILRVVKTDRKGNIKYDKDGNKKIIATSQNFEAGSIACGGKEILDADGTTFNAVVFEMSETGEKNRVAMFEFLAQNTNSEWSTFKGKTKSGDYLGILSSSHESSCERAASSLIDKHTFLGTAKISEWYHSHPRNSIETPSGYSYLPQVTPKYGEGDHGVAKYYNRQIPNLKVYGADSGTYYTFKIGGYSKDAKR